MMQGRQSSVEGALSYANSELRLYRKSMRSIATPFQLHDYFLNNRHNAELDPGDRMLPLLNSFVQGQYTKSVEDIVGFWIGKDLQNAHRSQKGKIHIEDAVRQSLYYKDVLPGTVVDQAAEAHYNGWINFITEHADAFEKHYSKDVKDKLFADYGVSISGASLTHKDYATLTKKQKEFHRLTVAVVSDILLSRTREPLRFKYSINTPHENAMKLENA